MVSIRKASEASGVSSYTLRYYEKIGLLPSPKRTDDGRRCYTEQDIRFISFLKNLKKTGMSLEEIQEFVKDGCIQEAINSGVNPTQLTPSISKRIDLLTKHLEQMEMKKKELEEVIMATKDKLDTYYSLLGEKEEEL
ncbi:MerR family transcriptional regulator [Paenibacillus puldeungensis]|uniref:MerR family transcriptional regulator n=1 Tax=Paenibacillus puldeungensis TaxID=696536 RepID=A0ABW3RRW7_9BACL